MSTAPRLASLLGHALLRADARRAEIESLCAGARRHGLAAVCVNPRWVALAAECLEGTGVDVATVIGFPLGATFGAAKAAETDEAVMRGAVELEMVIDLGALLDGDRRAVRRDIEQVVEAAQGRLVKVILETGLLSSEAKRLGATLARDAGADFVKTSTGLVVPGDLAGDVALLREVASDTIGVEASGGITDLGAAIAMLEAGADRIGTTQADRIVQQQEGSG